ncbi:MAG: DUF3662 and FHA domain-containing protein [Dehalococcoidales bacterium]|nr:DUF3662 and FHA domain-containing protein [Dehalococcoidales bacterium]
MRALEHFEAFVEGLVEGPFTRLLGGGVQPIQVAKLIEREIERNQRVGPDKVFVPNRFRVAVHPEDHAELSPIAAALGKELVTYAENLAKERGLAFLGPVAVDFEPNPAVGRHQLRVEGEMTAAPSETSAFHPSGGSLLDRTQPIDLSEVQSAPPAQPARAEIRLHWAEEDRVFPLPPKPVTIGRSIDNDLIIEDASVSRHHAEISFQAGHFSLTDLQSTNGTRVNRRRIIATLLKDGDRVQLGNVEMVFTTSRVEEP